ncbi:MAG: ABC transporter [bacterium P3]|nr:MAG: ABC transporter [bacterium P3]KWW33253.1 MAG: ABC transporter [bacterium F083]
MKSLKISDLTFSYRSNSIDNYCVFNNSSLCIDDSRIIGLIGINGSGKSTLLKLIKGDLPMQGGSIMIDNKSVTELRNVSFITQHPIDNIFPKLTVFENYILFHEKNILSFKGFANKYNRQLCIESIKKAGMGLEDRLDEQVRFLSGGQQQALGIMLACDISNPILLMDEPTASLDVFAAEKVLEIAIREICDRDGLLVFTSHNLRDIIQYTEHIVVIKKGGEMYNLSNEERNIDLIQLRNKML